MCIRDRWTLAYYESGEPKTAFAVDIACENSQHCGATNAQIISEDKIRNSILITCHYPDLHITLIWLVVLRGKFASTDQKQNSDLGGDMSANVKQFLGLFIRCHFTRKPQWRSKVLGHLTWYTLNCLPHPLAPSKFVVCASCTLNPVLKTLFGWDGLSGHSKYFRSWYYGTSV